MTWLLTIIGWKYQTGAPVSWILSISRLWDLDLPFVLSPGEPPLRLSLIWQLYPRSGSSLCSDFSCSLLLVNLKWALFHNILKVVVLSAVCAPFSISFPSVHPWRCFDTSDKSSFFTSDPMLSEPPVLGCHWWSFRKLSSQQSSPSWWSLQNQTETL